MATQINLDNAVVSLKNALESVQDRVANETTAYWKGLLDKPYKLHSNGTVQSTMSNPLAYFTVPLSGTGNKGRSHAFVLEQFQFALLKNWTSNAHVALRGINEEAIKAGMAYAMPRADSSLGTKQGRLLAHIASHTETTKKGKAELANTVCRIEATPSKVGRAIGLQSFQEKLEALKAAQTKRQAPKKAPTVEKPIQPEVTKPARKARGNKAA